jgi:hypothetical protein
LRLMSPFCSTLCKAPVFETYEALKSFIKTLWRKCYANLWSQSMCDVILALDGRETSIKNRYYCCRKGFVNHLITVRSFSSSLWILTNSPQSVLESMIYNLWCIVSTYKQQLTCSSVKTFSVTHSLEWHVCQILLKITIYALMIVINC